MPPEVRCPPAVTSLTSLIRWCSQSLLICTACDCERPAIGPHTQPVQDITYNDLWIHFFIIVFYLCFVLENPHFCSCFLLNILKLFFCSCCLHVFSTMQAAEPLNISSIRQALSAFPSHSCLLLKGHLSRTLLKSKLIQGIRKPWLLSSWNSATPVCGLSLVLQLSSIEVTLWPLHSSTKLNLERHWDLCCCKLPRLKKISRRSKRCTFSVWIE